jgi:hypothetical protein
MASFIKCNISATPKTAGKIKNKKKTNTYIPIPPITIYEKNWLMLNNWADYSAQF